VALLITGNHLAARREAEEETGLQVELIEQFQVYSDPAAIHASTQSVLCF